MSTSGKIDLVSNGSTPHISRENQWCVRTYFIIAHLIRFANIAPFFKSTSQMVDGLEVVNGDININVDKNGNVISYGDSFYKGRKQQESLTIKEWIKKEAEQVGERGRQLRFDSWRHRGSSRGKVSEGSKIDETRQQLGCVPAGTNEPLPHTRDT